MSLSVRKIRLIINVAVIASAAVFLLVRHCHALTAPSPDIPSLNEGHYSSLTKVNTASGQPEQIKNYTGFTVSFNPDTKTPNWVAWELLGSETVGTEKRAKSFWQDADIKNCPSSGDYKNSGFDRGHMIPAAEQKWSPEAMNDCFVMANICPQDHSLNSGAWNTLESKERIWAQRDSVLIIIAGPIYEKTDQSRIGDSGVRVPGSFFKVLLAPNADPPRAIGFIFPNMSAPGNLQAYSMSVDEVEKYTGHDFFYQLPDSIENILESKVSFREWNTTKR